MMNLTKAVIKKFDGSSLFELEIPLKNISKFNKKYLLVIILETESFIKITIYPIAKKRIIKLSLSDFKIIQRELDMFSEELQDFPIIHSSGLISIGPNSAFECYINLSLTDEKYQDLKILLDKNKSKFNDIKIEEISIDDKQ